MLHTHTPTFTHTSYQHISLPNRTIETIAVWWSASNWICTFTLTNKSAKESYATHISIHICIYIHKGDIKNFAPILHNPCILFNWPAAFFRNRRKKLLGALLKRKVNGDFWSHWRMCAVRCLLLRCHCVIGQILSFLFWFF